LRVESAERRAGTARTKCEWIECRSPAGAGRSGTCTETANDALCCIAGEFLCFAEPRGVGPRLSLLAEFLGRRVFLDLRRFGLDAHQIPRKRGLLLSV